VKSRLSLIIGIIIVLIGVSRIDFPGFFFLQWVDGLVTIALIAIGVWLIVEAGRR